MAEKPVIASGVSGLAKVVQDAGVLFPKYDSLYFDKMIKETFLSKISIILSLLGVMLKE